MRDKKGPATVQERGSGMNITGIDKLMERTDNSIYKLAVLTAKRAH